MLVHYFSVGELGFSVTTVVLVYIKYFVAVLKNWVRIFISSVGCTLVVSWSKNILTFFLTGTFGPSNFYISPDI